MSVAAIARALCAVVAAVVLFGTASSAQTPPVTCSRFAAEVDAFVCRDAALSTLDRTLALAYAEVVRKQRPPLPRWVTNGQKHWLRARNACWTESDRRACISAEYTRRIAEIQARGKLVPFTGPVKFRCMRLGGRDEIIATFHRTDPPSAILERGARSVVALLTPSASGARYRATNVTFGEQDGEAQAKWFGLEMQCTSR